MGKKKFKETKIGKLLTSRVAKGLLKSLPLGVGQIAGNILDEKKGDGKGEVVSEAGSIDWKDPATIVSAVATLVLMYLALTGKLTWEEAEQAKSFIE